MPTISTYTLLRQLNIRIENLVTPRTCPGMPTRRALSCREQARSERATRAATARPCQISRWVIAGPPPAEQRPPHTRGRSLTDVSI